MKFEIDGIDMVKKIVKSGQHSGRIFVPKNWIDKEVIVILKDDTKE